MQNTPSRTTLPSLMFFGDASSKDKKFMVAGGFAVNSRRIREVEARIASLRELGGIQSEFHWSAYRGGDRREAYERLVDYAFELIEAKHAALHVIVTKFEGYDHKAKAGENKDTSVNRMYFQLCLHRIARFYGKQTTIHVRLDVGNDADDVCGMRNEVCAKAYKQHKTRPNCIRTLETMNSKSAGLIQMADVIVGAIAAKQNNVQHTSPKGDLADHVLKRSGLSTWGRSTPMNARFLTVWHFEGRPPQPYP
ncbi:MAG: DUF3800 domain-containing protein [Alphaproteobacteria bacterium]|nr:MAG: DUF3800 domain-containing protein [Alphaproteobacteria bacterium]